MKKKIALICALGIELIVFSTHSYGRVASVLSVYISAFNNVTCNGSNNGSATVTATGGSAPYTYSWAPGGGTNSTASNLSAGTYTVTVTDANSSTDTASVTITQPSPLMASISLSSYGGQLTAIVDASGKAGYSGDGGPATAAEVYAPTSVTTDKYRNIYISDWDNRRIRKVDALSGIITTIAGNGVTGFSGDGGPATACEFGGTTDASVDSSGNLWVADYLNNAIYVVTNSTTNPWPNNVNGGNPTTAGYIYLFNTAKYSLVQNLFFDATGNMYILDQYHIGFFLIVTNSTTNPWPNIINGGNPTVPGATYTMASGGLRYQGLTFDKAGNLYYTSLDFPCIYVITKTTTNPWPALINSGNPTIPGQTYILYTLPIPAHHTGPGPTWLAFDKYQNLYVANYYSNQIYVVPWQGNSTSGYPYVNMSGVGGYTTNGDAGSGHIFWPASCMIDNENNMYISDQTVSPNSGIQKIVIAYNHHIPCYGSSSGSAIATVSGGTGPYSYLWSNGQSSNPVNGLSAGTYSVLVTDSNGCTANGIVTLTQPTAMTITHDSVAENGNCNGLAAVTIGGATPPYNYLWSTAGQTSDTIYDQCAGSYCCVITDYNGCTQSACVDIATGIDQLKSDSAEVEVYPNPSRGVFTINFLGAQNFEPVQIEIYNVLGEQVYSTNYPLTTNHYSLDLSSNPNGIYLYRVIANSGNIIGEGKLVIEK
jgi:hypothetical protein